MSNDPIKTLTELVAAGAKLDHGRYSYNDDAEISVLISDPDNEVEGHVASHVGWASGEYFAQAANARDLFPKLLALVEAAAGYVEANSEYAKVPSPHNELDAADAYAELKGNLQHLGVIE